MTSAADEPKQKPGDADSEKLFTVDSSIFASDRQDRDMRAALKRILEVGIGSRAVVGQRMVAARKAWGLSQEVAAGYLGYETGAQLSLIECGRKPIPTHTLCAASRLYNVSGDYLLGLTDAPEVDARGSRRAEAVRRMHYTLTGIAAVLHDVIDRSLGPVDSISALGELVPAAEDAAAAMARFRELNKKKFLEMPGGATVARTISALDEAVSAAVVVLRKSRAMDSIKLHEMAQQQGRIDRELRDGGAIDGISDYSDACDGNLAGGMGA
jgi:transcriptional regulator with XRE-family HTH domain